MTPRLPLGIGVPGLPNPFQELGEAAAKAAADGWTFAMLALWDAGLFLLRVVLELMHGFLTPDLSAGGPAQRVYVYTFWIAAVLVVLMVMVQLGVAAFRREGKALARVLIGSGQFAVVWAAWIGYGVALIAACGGLTTALMTALLNVNTWSEWDPFGAVSTDDITDGAVATVLGLLGLVLWIAAIGHLLVLLTRAAALLVLVATAPVSAAGLVSDAGRSWFWKSLRWFHAAAFTPVLMVLVLGLGVQLSTGVAEGLTDGVQATVATALPGVVLICVSAVSPLALFKLLAFVDPGTPSGAAVRAGLAAQGGLPGLLGGKAAGVDGGSSAAADTDANGRSAGESGAQRTTADRFTKTTQTDLAAVGGPALSAGLGLVQSIGTKGAAIGADVTNQMGVGHHAHQPDFSGGGDGQQDRAGSSGRGDSGDSDDNSAAGSGPRSQRDDPAGTGADGDGGPVAGNPAAQNPPAPALAGSGAGNGGSSGGRPPGGGTGPGAGAGGSAGTGGGEAAAAAV